MIVSDVPTKTEFPQFNSNLLVVPHRAAVVPGHGRWNTIFQVRSSNPFLPNQQPQEEGCGINSGPQTNHQYRVGVEGVCG